MRSLLLPSFNRAFRRGLHTTTFVTCGFSRSYNQAAQVPSSNVTCRLPRSPWTNWRMVLALVSRMDSITSYARRIQDRDRDRFLVNIQADILRAIHRGCSFLEGLRRTLQTYSKRGALLYCVGFSECGPGAAWGGPHLMGWSAADL